MSETIKKRPKSPEKDASDEPEAKKALHKNGTMEVSLVISKKRLDEIYKDEKLDDSLTEDPNVTVSMSPATAIFADRIFTFKSKHVNSLKAAVLRCLENTEGALASHVAGQEPFKPEARIVVKQECIGSILGYKGVIVKNIRMKTDTYIKVLQGADVPKCVTGDDQVVKIFGNLKNLLEAADSILDCICGTFIKAKTVVASKKGGLIKQEKLILPPHPGVTAANGVVDTKFRLYVPEERAQIILARSGELVARVRDDTGATITVFEPFKGDRGRIVLTESVDQSNNSAAQEALLRIVFSIYKFTETRAVVQMLIPSNQIGAIFGYKGIIIESLRKETGTALVVMPREHRPLAAEEKDELFEVAGSFYQIMPALIKSTTYLREVMGRLPPPLPILPHNEIALRPPIVVEPMTNNFAQSQKQIMAGPRVIEDSYQPYHPIRMDNNIPPGNHHHTGEFQQFDIMARNANISFQDNKGPIYKIADGIDSFPKNLLNANVQYGLKQPIKLQQPSFVIQNTSRPQLLPPQEPPQSFVPSRMGTVYPIAGAMRVQKRFENNMMTDNISHMGLPNMNSYETKQEMILNTTPKIRMLPYPSTSASFVPMRHPAQNTQL